MWRKFKLAPERERAIEGGRKKVYCFPSILSPALILAPFIDVTIPVWCCTVSPHLTVLTHIHVCEFGSFEAIDLSPKNVNWDSNRGKTSFYLDFNISLHIRWKNYAWIIILFFFFSFSRFQSHLLLFKCSFSSNKRSVRGSRKKKKYCNGMYRIHPVRFQKYFQAV